MIEFTDCDSLDELLVEGKQVLFVCVGTDRSTGDSLGPLVGTHLLEMGYSVLGTLDNPVHAHSLPDAIDTIDSHYPEHLVIAIDCCLGKGTNVGKIRVGEGYLNPGAGVGKSLPSVGDVFIKGVVNVSSGDIGMNHMLLQCTRLSVVMGMAHEIVGLCHGSMMRVESKKRSFLKDWVGS